MAENVAVVIGVPAAPTLVFGPRSIGIVVSVSGNTNSVIPFRELNGKTKSGFAAELVSVMDSVGIPVVGLVAVQLTLPWTSMSRRVRYGRIPSGHRSGLMRLVVELTPVADTEMSDMRLLDPPVQKENCP